jgi:hypothetical protein
MTPADQFVSGELALEDALLGEGPEGRVVIFLTLGDDYILMGVREEGCEPAFTRLPKGLSAGFGTGAGRVLQALDYRPRRKAGTHQQPVPRSPGLASEFHPAVVTALTELVKEGGEAHADN